MGGRSNRKWPVALVVGVLAGASALLAVATPGPSAGAEQADTSADGVQHLHFAYGPITIKSGQNTIEFSKGQVPKPEVDGWIVGIRPNIQKANGKVPPVDVIHLHHGVWLNYSRKDSTRPGLPERFFAAGEEKTQMVLPAGYGYAYRASDNWTINYMVHDLTPAPFQISITYDIDFIPKDSPAAAGIKSARPIWMDVENGGIYPVFDVLKGTGTDGTYTYPTQATDPYRGRAPKNEWTVDRDGILIATGGHLHPGGLHDDLWLRRAGAGATASTAAKTSIDGDTAHLFQSKAKYFEPAGAVSWDVAMTITRPDWSVQVHAGDVLSTTTTYDTKRASWYESMGIMVVFMADGTGGRDPFQTPVDQRGKISHGHLPENDHHGGKLVTMKNPLKFSPVAADPANQIDINDYIYETGDFTGPGTLPTVKAGQQLTFFNQDAPKEAGIWHSLTACKAPCNKATGIAYPIADADVGFDSGQLGKAGEPTAGTLSWKTPADLAPGTYTYFCRIHPFMRGAFEIQPS
jgi:plastocyanin